MLPRNFETAKLLQVRGEPLGVKQREFLRAQMFYQRHQRDLRCVRLTVEHALAEKRPADVHAVKTTDQLSFPTRLDAMRVPVVVQLAIAAKNFG